MDSKITINIVEPGSGPTPDPVVPNTGLFTSGIGGPEATAIGTVLILTIAAIVVAVCYRKQKKSGKVTKLVHIIDSTKAVLKSKKRVTAGLSAIALLASAGTLTTLLANAGKSNTNAIEGDNLTLDVTGGDITIEVADEPVFAVAEVKATVKEATQAGYTLTAYTDNTDLVSTTDSSKVIPMVAADEGELAVLADNTYGLAFTEPEDKDSEIYTTLSTDQDNPTLITDKDYEATEENDKTTIYYGFYITPDVPYGTYTSGDVHYEAEKNIATILAFDGNGSDGGAVMEKMVLLAGDTTTLPENTYTREGYKFVGWNTNAAGTGRDYVDEAEYTAIEGEFAEVTLYAQWEYNGPCLANHICYRGNGASTATNMDNVVQYTTGTSTGKQVDLLASNFTKAGHGFVGWSEDKDAWAHLTEEGTAIPIIYGPNQTITVGDLSEEGMYLYAIWVPAETMTSGESVELQNWNGCSSLTATTYSNGALTVGKNTVTALTDGRDGNVYTVARLADGNCWMVENLRLGNKPELSTTNTNNPSLPLTNDYATSATSNKLSAPSNSWCDSAAQECLDQSNLNMINVVDTVASPEFNQDFTSSAHQDFDVNIVSYGNYYNWYSATAGNGTYEKISGNVAGDICPAGWHLPYGGYSSDEKGGNTSGGFYYLNQQMGGDTSIQGSKNWRSFPNNFVYPGRWSGSLVRFRGNDGRYLSSTVSSYGGAHLLYLIGGNVNPDSTIDSSFGSSVRCVASGQ